MPVYEYECKNCGKRFDKIQPVTSEALKVCELCGEGPIRRVFQPVGVIFKGSGWYVTDNRTGGKPAESSTTKGAGGEKAGDSAPSSGKGASTSEKSSESSSKGSGSSGAASGE